MVRFGGPADANCSTSAPNIEGMGWEATIGGTGFLNSSFVPWRVKKLDVWKLSASCYVTLEDETQCGRFLAITVYSKYKLYCPIHYGLLLY